MIITDVKKIDSKKSLVCIDYEPAFALYNFEMRRLEIKVNEDISKEVYNGILSDILIKRCRERVGYILGKSDKSVYEIKSKLKQGYYPESVIKDVIEEYLRYGYLDDERYAFNYVKNNMSRKSVKKIRNELSMKGISKEVINKAFMKSEIEYEAIDDVQFKIIEKEFYKKKYDFKEDDRMILNKIIASLLRKGFELDDVMRVYNRMKSKNVC